MCKVGIFSAHLGAQGSGVFVRAMNYDVEKGSLLREVKWHVLRYHVSLCDEFRLFIATDDLSLLKCLRLKP